MADFASRQANAIQVPKMCQAFRATGHEVVLTGFGPAREHPEGVRQLVPRWPFRKGRQALQKAISSWQLHRFAPDLVFTRSIVLGHHALSSGVPVVLDLHDLPPPDRAAHRLLRESLVHPGLCRVLTTSRGMAEDLAANFDTSQVSVLVAHNGVEPGPRPGVRRAKTGGPALRVGYFGHLYPGKGMEMIAALAPEVPEVHFDVYGGTERDLAFWRAKTADVENLTLHGHIPHAQVRPSMEACDLLIAPYGSKVTHSGSGDISRWMSPLKLFEYMAAERAVITSDMAVLREILTHGETAFLCPPDDVKAWVDGVRQLAADPVLRCRLAEAGRDLLENEYTRQRRAERALQDVLCGGSMTGLLVGEQKQTD